MAARRLSVTMVVAATLVTVTTLLLGALGTANSLSERKKEMRRLGNEISAHADELSVGLALPVWNIDRAQINKIVDGQTGTPPIYGIVIDAAGQTHARVRDAGWKLVRSDGRFPTAGLLEQVRPIVFNGERIGTVRVFGTPRFVERSLHASLISVVVATVLMDLLLIAFVYLVLWRTVLRPLVQIEQYAGAVSAGREGETQSLGPEPTAELESLRTSIESMVRLLDERYRELQNEAARRLGSEEALRRSETMSAMGALVAGVAHEVRNPLFGMSALLDAYAEEMKASADLEELSKGLREQVTRLTHLMRELLEFGRPVQITLAPGSVGTLIDEVIGERSAAAAQARVQLHVETDPSLPAVAMDRGRLRQVFENLIDNALQHAPAVRNVTVRASAATSGGRLWVECVVADDGSGFQPADLGRVFEPFFTRRERGIGLGMSIVERIVGEHGGRVSAANGAEGGAVITLRLPAAPVPSEVIT